MANIPLSTIGLKVSYAIEVGKGVKPLSGYNRIYGFKSTPDFNPAPTTEDATTFDNLEFSTKIELLKEMPDALSFDAILGQEFIDNWEEMYLASIGALKDGYRTWFCIDVPGLNKSLFFPGKPSKLSLNAYEKNTGAEQTVYVVPIGEPVFASDPTYAEDITHIVKFVVTGATTEDFIDGADILIFGKGNAKTDSNGEASFDLKDGNYNYKVSKAGIVPQFGELTVDGANVNIDITDFNV